jgi:hypothetical protein
MTGGLWGSGLRTQVAVKRKVFVSYYHGGDQLYYDKSAGGGMNGLRRWAMRLSSRISL